MQVSFSCFNTKFQINIFLALAGVALYNFSECLIVPGLSLCTCLFCIWPFYKNLHALLSICDSSKFTIHSSQTSTVCRKQHCLMRFLAKGDEDHMCKTGITKVCSNCS